jgi:NIMA (never in mitosis gene a)-related kinase
MEDYKIIAEIGKGSYGKALHAAFKRTGAEVVIKVIELRNMSLKQRSDALNEANVLRGLRHPFIVKHITHFASMDALCIVSEYAAGGDLSKIIHAFRTDKKYLEESRILRWFTQIVLGLAFLHSKNIMHRDIKPQNIFVSGSRDRVLIGDFGICRVLETKKALAQTMIGSPYYMSPEQFQHRPYSLKSDIWALGCLLFEIASLTVPFQAADVFSLSLRVCRGSNPSFPSRYSTDLKSLFSSLLQRDYHARPSAEQLLTYPIVSKVAQSLGKEETLDSCRSRTPVPCRNRSPSPVTKPPSCLPVTKSPRTVSPYRAEVPPKPQRLPMGEVRAQSPVANLRGQSPRPPLREKMVTSPRTPQTVRQGTPQTVLVKSPLTSPKIPRFCPQENRKDVSARAPQLYGITSPKIPQMVHQDHRPKASSGSPFRDRITSPRTPLRGEQADYQRILARSPLRERNVSIYPPSPLKQRLN